MAENEKNITADDIHELLSIRYEDIGRYVCAAEVGNGTGGLARRHVDFMAVHCWDSDNFKIEAFEIKISKSDLKRELEDPSKHNVFFADIDFFWIVAPDYVLDDISLLPSKWGVMKVVRKDGKLELKVARKPVALNDEHVRDRKISRPFMASLCRAINTKSTAMFKLSKLKAEIREEVKEELQRTVSNGGVVVPKWEYDEMKRCSDICKSLDISTWTSHLSDYERRAFREARNIAERVRWLDHTLQDAGARIKDTRSKLKGILEGSEGAIKALKAAEEAVAKDQSREASNEKDSQGSQGNQEQEGVFV